MRVCLTRVIDTHIYSSHASVCRVRGGRRSVSTSTSSSAYLEGAVYSIMRLGLKYSWISFNVQRSFKASELSRCSNGSRSFEPYAHITSSQEMIRYLLIDQIKGTRDDES